MAAGQFPTLWDPENLLVHLALWAGAPAIGVAIVVWLLGVYSTGKSWLSLGKSAARAASAAQYNVRRRTSAHHRAMVRLVFSSVFMVAFSYMLAEIIYVVVRMVEADPTAQFSVTWMRSTAVAVTPWPFPVVSMVVLEVAGIALLGVARIAELRSLQSFVTFLGGLTRAVAWTGTVVLTLLTVGGFLSPYFTQNQGPSAATPLSLAVTMAVAACLCLGWALSLTKVWKASDMAFSAT
jgi:hypothetical protein